MGLDLGKSESSIGDANIQLGLRSADLEVEELLENGVTKLICSMPESSGDSK